MCGLSMSIPFLIFQLALLKAFQGGVHLSLEQLLVGGVVDNLGSTGDAILGQIKICHSRA